MEEENMPQLNLLIFVKRRELFMSSPHHIPLSTMELRKEGIGRS